MKVEMIDTGRFCFSIKETTTFRKGEVLGDDVPEKAKLFFVSTGKAVEIKEPVKKTEPEVAPMIEPEVKKVVKPEVKKSKKGRKKAE